MTTTKKIESNLSALSNLLGSENVEDIQKRIGDVIVSRVEKDLDDYDCYLFFSPDYQESINQAYDKVEKKLTKMYTDAMLEVAEQAVAKFKEVALKSLENVNKEFADGKDS